MKLSQWSNIEMSKKNYEISPINTNIKTIGIA